MGSNFGKNGLQVATSVKGGRLREELGNWPIRINGKKLNGNFSGNEEDGDSGPQPLTHENAKPETRNPKRKTRNAKPACGKQARNL